MKTKNLIAWALSLALTGILFVSCAEQQKGSSKSKNEMSVRQIPIEDFFRNPEKSSYKISPDGKYYSFMAPHQDRMNVFIQEIGKSEAIQVTFETERDLAGYTWGSNTRILYLKDTGGDENFKLFAVNIDGKNAIALTDFDGVRTRFIDDLEDNPNEIIIGMNKRNPQIFDAYRVNIETGDTVMIAQNRGDIQGWMTDHDGKLRIATATDGVETSLLYRETEADEFQEVLKTNFKESADPLFFDFDNNNVYVASNLGRDKSAIVLFDIRNGVELEELYAHPEVDVSSLMYSKKRKVLTAISYYTDKSYRHFLDPQTEDLINRLKQDLGEYEISISSSTKDEMKYIVRTYSDRSMGSYYIYDKNTDKLDKIVDVANWIDEKEMATMKPIKYTTRDGLTINGYLTLPVGVEAKDLPVIINPHGGPWARDRWGFNPEIQFLANRGYAVLQMNFRGSTGYGRKFWEASFKQWGKTMQDDITDGANWLVEQGIADQDRIAIYGASYGGYATLAGLAFTPDLYACGIDYVGVSNLFSFMNTIPKYWIPFLDMLYEQVGHPEKDSLMLADVSPALQAHKITAPLFIAQGANDPRVNKDESDQMVAAMKERGVEVEYMVKDNEGHGFHNQENQFDFYRAMEKFLKTHM